MSDMYTNCYCRRVFSHVLGKVFPQAQNTEEKKGEGTAAAAAVGRSVAGATRLAAPRRAVLRVPGTSATCCETAEEGCTAGRCRLGASACRLVTDIEG